MNIIILSIIVYYILILILYYYGNLYTNSIFFIFIYISLLVGFVTLVYKENIKSISGRVIKKEITGSSDRTYHQLYRTILGIRNITNQLNHTQENIEVEIERIQNLKEHTNSDVYFSNTIQKQKNIEEIDVYPIIQNNKTIELERAITMDHSTYLNTTDPYIQKMVKAGASDILHVSKNPLSMTSWQSINSHTYVHSDKRLTIIDKKNLPYYYIANYINQKQQVFPKIFTIYEYDNKIYIEMEQIHRILDLYIKHDMPKEILDALPISEKDKSNILFTYQRKLPTKYVDVPMTQHEINNITFSKNDYNIFLTDIQKRYNTTFQSLTKQLQSIHKKLKKEKWSYSSFLCGDIGIRKNGTIVLTNPICIKYDPLYQSYIDYKLHQYSIDGIYTMKMIQVPIDTSETNSQNIKDILKMKITLDI